MTTAPMTMLSTTMKTVPTTVTSTAAPTTSSSPSNPVRQLENLSRFKFFANTPVLEKANNIYIYFLLSYLNHQNQQMQFNQYSVEIKRKKLKLG